MARPQNGSPDAAHDGYRGPTAPPITAPAWKRRLFIDRPADLEALASDLAAAHILAIDAEFVQVRGHVAEGPGHRLALLQFAVDNDYRASYVVDALRLPDLAPLQRVLTDGAILKLFHGVSADLKMLATRGLEVVHLLDLEAVSRSIFGQRESGLQAMLQRAASIRIDKSLQRADWGRRPLTPAMVAYAARDAEMTYVLYGWLAANYGWAVAQQEIPANEATPAVAPWILPFLDGGRGRQAEYAVAEAGLAGNIPAQERALRAALAALPHPGQRSRVMRLITDLNLIGLRPALRPYLDAPAADERASAIRSLGRLRDIPSRERIEALRDDPVEDVRMAAATALEYIDQPHRPNRRTTPPVSTVSPESPGVWTVSGEESDASGASGATGTPTAAGEDDDWRAALRARFGLTNGPASGDDGNGDDGGE